MLKTVAPKNWSMEDAWSACHRAAELIMDEREHVEQRLRNEANGCYDSGERIRRHRIFDRAEKLAAAWKCGVKFEMVGDAIRKLEAEQAEILADAMAEARGK